MLTQAWAAEMGKYNVYAVRPGYLLTKLSAGQPDSAGSIVSATPLGRGGGYDINGPEVFFTSETSGHVSGQILTLDGGGSSVILSRTTNALAVSM
jgi:NAD(P)-dependent dehydrogenase (short-subunit alcohol dehydrogenase family)